MNINRKPVLNSCLGGCGRKFSGFKRYVCPECSMLFVRENIDMELISSNDFSRSKLGKQYQPCILAQLTTGQILKILRSDVDQDYKKRLMKGVLQVSDASIMR